MITIEQMQYILELSKTHSFHKTAENLYVSQPAISKAIKKAEDELSIKLFERSSQGVYPTQAGLELVKIIDELLIHFSDLYLTANYFSYYRKSCDIKVVQIYSHNSIGNYVLPQIVTGVHSYIGDLELRVIEVSPEESLDKIKIDPNGIGIGVFGKDISLEVERPLRVTKLCQAEPHLVVNREMMPLNINVGESVSLKKLSECPLVLNQFSPPLSKSLLKEMSDNGSEPKIILRCPTAAIFTKYITEGLACGIVTKLGHFFMFPSSLKNIVYFPVESKYQFNFFLYSHEEFPKELYSLFYHLLHRLLILG